jgi:uncharacterized MAPEG superfamily protein
MSAEISFLTLTAAFTGILWMPLIINRLHEMGAWSALKNPQPDVRPKAEWAYRLSNAHRNALENLAVFAPLAIAVHILGVGDALTSIWATVFFAARVAHAAIYTAGIPLLRTIAFFAGFVAQMVFAGRLFGLL